jgi:hypothetical protein
MHYIGKELLERIEILNISAEELSEIAFIDNSVIKKLCNNQIPFEELDDFEKELICSALHCDAEYFTDKKVRNRDLLISSMNRGKDSAKSIKVKTIIQDYMRDYAMLNKLQL